MQESKQAVTKITSLVKLAENLLVVSSPLELFWLFQSQPLLLFTDISYKDQVLCAFKLLSHHENTPI